MRIDSPKISRRHCCIALAYDRVIARDLGSRNGVRVNGVLVEEARLNDRDEIAIGPLIYRVEHAVPAPAPPPPAPVLSVPTPVGKPEPSLPQLPASLDDDELVPLLD